jgi:protein-S-isoprenylcysteine O-methyltransferase Ste14
MGWLLLSVVLWGIVHSILATNGVKNWIFRVLGRAGSRFYRIGYNFFSVISLAPILWLWWSLPDSPVYQISAPWVYLTVLGQLLALVALVVGFIQTDVFAFVGVRQLLDGVHRDEKFVTQGLYHWVRHPLYTAGLMFMWLTPVVSRNTLVFFIAASLYLIIGAHFEERKLVRQFGPAYIEYKAATPMLIPGIVFHRD